jgi:protein ImuB
VPAEPAADAQALAALAAWCGRYTPWTAVEPAGLAGPLGGAAGVWLEATGCAHLFGGEEALLADLTDRLHRIGYAARTAIADTPGAAWAAARYGADDGLVVAPGGARAALAALPVAALRLPPAAVAGLEGLGLRRIGDLYDIPRAALAARYGAAVAGRLDAALGAVHEPISPAPPPTDHVARLAFAEPIGRPEDIAAGLDRLLAALCAGLEAAQAGARELVLWLYRPDGGCERIAVGTSRPNRTPAHLARLFAEHLEPVDLGFGFEAMRLDAAVVEPLGPVQPDFEAGAATAGATGLDALIDRLSNRLGAAQVRRLQPQASHLPERAVQTVPALAAAPPAAAAAWTPPGAPPRPLRLLPRPEPVEAVAPVPDDPPVMFRWRRVVHRVARAEGPERIAPEWWRDGAPDDGSLRDYYRVEDTAGGRYWLYREGLYRDGAAPSWFLHGVFG